ncbi:MAG TPA: PEGA domain-containing protein [Polyangiaceae bacterium]|nr:PEGA domain-containing protein [Polyangiaceae bacterium]
MTVPAAAQSAADDPTTAMARARFKEGVEFYDKGEYEQARASFLQAYALKKHPAVLLNLAWSCVKSGHPLEADRYFKQFLAEGRDITEKQRADANEGLAQAHAKLGRIEVVAAPGAEVTVDGEKVGTAPLAEAAIVEPGAHTVKVRALDGSIETQSITVMGGEKAVARFKLAPTPAPSAAPTPAAPSPEEPAAPPAPSSPPAPPRTSEEPKPRAEHARPLAAPPEPEGKSIFATPKNVMPAVVLGIGAAAGYGVAVAMFFYKQTAQDRANAAADLVNHGGCGTQPLTSCSLYADYQTDVGNVNDDATVGNIALAVGVAGTAGALIYWLVADKQEDVRASSRPVVTPLVGRGMGGAALGGRF